MTIVAYKYLYGSFAWWSLQPSLKRLEKGWTLFIYRYAITIKWS